MNQELSKGFVLDFLNNYKQMMEDLPAKSVVYFIPVETTIPDKKYPIKYLQLNLEISASIGNLIYRCKILYAHIPLLFATIDAENQKIQEMRQKFDEWTTNVKVEFANHHHLYQIEYGRLLTPKEVAKSA
jgi:hypothetical protein